MNPTVHNDTDGLPATILRDDPHLVRHHTDDYDLHTLQPTTGSRTWAKYHRAAAKPLHAAWGFRGNDHERSGLLHRLRDDVAVSNALIRCRQAAQEARQALIASIWAPTPLVPMLA